MEPDLDQITSSLEELFARIAAAQEAAPTAELRDQLAALRAALAILGRRRRPSDLAEVQRGFVPAKTMS